MACLTLAACESNPIKPAASTPANDNNPSPTAGGATSQRANEMADKAMYKEVEYKNIAKKGPQLVVIPGEVKSNNATFTQKFGPNNIADFAELELGRANFGVLERNDLGPMMREFQLAYTMGDPKAARKVLQKGKLKTTKWVVKFDILKAEQVAQAQKSFDGQAIGRLAGIAIGGREGHAVDTIGGSIKTGESTGVWVIGMRFKILDANTTEQKATGYTEEKMEVGAKAQSVLGFSEGAKGGVTLDTMVQRLVQKLVWEIDSKYK
jgi:PAS domain-containing protein